MTHSACLFELPFSKIAIVAGTLDHSSNQWININANQGPKTKLNKVIA